MSLFGGQQAPVMPNLNQTQATSIFTQVTQSGVAATLFIFSPRFIPNQYRRPYDYRLGDGVKSAIADKVDRRLRGGSYSTTDTFLLDIPEARGAVLPATIGTPINLQAFSEFWTFLLVVDNENGLTPTGFQTTLPTRVIYAGWFVNEPVAKKNLSQSYVLNPSSMLVVAHQTVLSLRQTMGPTGYQGVDVISDYDFAPTSSLQSINPAGENVYDLNPAEVIKVSATSPDLEGTIGIWATPVAAREKALTIPTELQDPTRHLSHLVSQAIETPILTLNGFNGAEAIDTFMGGQVALSSFGALLGQAIPTVLTKIQCNQPISLGEVCQIYPQLNYQVINIPTMPSYDIIDTAAPTASNVFSSLLYAAMPGILAQYGLAEIAFRYNSYAHQPGGLGSMGEKRGVYELQNIAPLYQCNQNEIQAKWVTMQTYLDVTLFPIIKTAAGDFDLMVHCSIGGVSLIHLNLLDHAPVQGFVENNNLLGGINTATVGSDKDVSNNSAQLVSMVNDLVPLTQSQDRGMQPGFLQSLL